VHEAHDRALTPGEALFRQRAHESFADAQPRLQEKGIIIGNRLLDKGFHLLSSLRQGCFSSRFLRGPSDFLYLLLPVLQFVALFEF
jgi:hypothetical protein